MGPGLGPDYHQGFACPRGGGNSLTGKLLPLTDVDNVYRAPELR